MSKMNWNIVAGHNPDGKVACGAIGFIKESTENRNVKNEVVRLLTTLGHKAKDCTIDNGSSSSNVLTRVVTLCNANGDAIDVHIHFNAGAKDENGNKKTTGTEVFVYSMQSAAVPYAQAVCNAIAELGFKNRGVKVNKNLYVLRKSKNPAMLIECCFVDDKDDVALYEYKAMAEAIVYGLTGEKYAEVVNDDADPDINLTVEEPSGDKDALYRVQVGAYSKKANAETMQKKLHVAGFDTVIVKS